MDENYMADETEEIEDVIPVSEDDSDDIGPDGSEPSEEEIYSDDNDDYEDETLATDVGDETEVSVTWYKDGVPIGEGETLEIAAGDVDRSAVYSYKAFDSEGNVVAETDVTLSNIDDNLIYDHDYTIDGNVANFTAHLYQGDTDVTNQYDPEQFSWYYKTEDNESSYLGSGYTCPVNLSDMGYGGHIIGSFVKSEDSELLTEDDDTITTSDDLPITGRTPSGETVRVSDLTVSTTLYPAEKIMIIGTEDEHLVSIQTLAQHILNQYGPVDYEDLINKPKIEGVTLIGDKTFPELNLDVLSNLELEALLT